MPFGSKTYTKRALLLLAVFLSMPVAGFALATEDQLTDAKQQFTELWSLAAETTKKRSSLEEELATFDDRVSAAKQDLAKAADERKSVRERMTEQKALIEALNGQLHAAADADAFYQAVAVSQRDDFIKFIRYMSSKDIAIRESGPAIGGPALKRIIRGSLGDSIEDGLARDAILKARRTFLGQVQTLVGESERVRSRLMSVATDLSKELTVLEKQHASISSLVDEKTSFIDSSWKEKKLTEQQLKEVAQEADEASQRIAAMQQSLVSINQELKDAKVKGLQEQLDAFTATREKLEEEREVLQRKDEALRLIEDQAIKDLQVTVQMRNTDTKLYKRIEEQELKRADLQRQWEQLTASGSLAATPDSENLQGKIEFIDEVLILMKQGVPLEPAETYIRSRFQAESVGDDRKVAQQQIADLGPKIAEAVKAESDQIQAIEVAKNASELEGLPIFVWPVLGTITAGYFDTQYEAVFGVPHRAIDIAVPQATPVRAITDGIVYAVKDGGATGYSYILIAHRDGYASLYGHVSAAMVKKGDIVSAGQIIALSGGTPGTHGAGHMTTGAHLHIEITKDGQHIDPRNVLPAR